MGDAPDPELTSRMQKPCMNSHHPSVHICKKQPKTNFARKIHRKMKRLLNRLKKKEKRRKNRQRKIRKLQKKSDKRDTRKGRHSIYVNPL